MFRGGGRDAPVQLQDTDYVGASKHLHVFSYLTLLIKDDVKPV